MTDDLHTRWNELTRHVADEFVRNSQDPGAAFEPDESTLRLRARTANDPPEWFTVTLSPEQVQTADLRTMASEFYAAYRAALRK